MLVLLKKINEIEVCCNNDKLISTIEHAYRKAPYYNEVFPVIDSILTAKETNLARYLKNSPRSYTWIFGDEEISYYFIRDGKKTIYRKVMKR